MLAWLMTAFLVVVALLYLLRDRAAKFAGFDDVLLSAEALNTHARELARQHRTATNNRLDNGLLARMNDNYRLMAKIYHLAEERARQGETLPPAAEWLLDNFFVIEEQVKEIRQTFSRKDFRELKVLTSGLMKNYPRAYALALELVSHTDGRLDQKTLVDFINSYQSVRALDIAEIWSLALLSRLALLENLRRLCEGIKGILTSWQAIEALGQSTAPAQKYQEFIKAMREPDAAVVEHLVQKLRQLSTDSSELAQLLDNRLAEFGTSAREMVRQQHQLLAAHKVSVGNSITSLRLIQSLDWNDIFECLCPVYKILSQDPVFVAMDFPSRDYYRRRLQKTARKAKTSETRVARKLIECIRQAREEGKGDLSLHIGHYLVGQGRPELLARLRGGREWKRPAWLYFVALAALTIGLAALPAATSGQATAAAFLLALLPASELALTIVNRCTSWLVQPSFLPKLEFRNGIPPGQTTAVVVPALLTSPRQAREMVAQLEVHYHANKEDDLRFVLLADFRDAASQHGQEDGEIIQAAAEDIAALNARHGSQGDIFFYLHRPRVYSETQGRWLGWERKRGALLEFNRLLLAGDRSGFTHITGDLDRLRDIKYVITLDADTRLPIDGARKLVGALAHPLNREYGLIQPRIGMDIESATATPFARLFAGHGGIDPYTTAVSDVYQDLFGRGIFTGKGIYRLAEFQQAVQDVIPENSVLSHDLLEGSLVVTGLATDIQLTDDFPCRYRAYMQRHHRWTRGDWQLLPWLLPWVRNRAGERIANPLPLLARWKIFDNLRRSLVSPTLVAAVLFAGLGFGNPVVWLALVFATIGLPSLLAWLDNWGLPGRSINSTLAAGPGIASLQVLFSAALLLHRAWICCDAIGRTLYRVTISRRNLLEWTTAAEAARRARDGKQMAEAWQVVLTATLMAVLVALTAPANLTWLSPLFILWLASPLLADHFSRPIDYRPCPPGEEEASRLRLLARQTWNYFEDLAVDSENYLPPDNFQQDPALGVDHRTSPTNIGFLLLSTLAARDLGFISTTAMLDRVERTLATIEKLEKWHGHLYNWYDTRTLRVLRPRYISTVDNGNFAAFLLTLRQGLEEYLHRPLVDGALFAGLRDTLVLEGKENLAQALSRWVVDKGTDLSVWQTAVNELASHKPGGRSQQMLAMFRQEIDQLLPHTEILLRPPVFVHSDQRFSRLARLVDGIKHQSTPLGRTLTQVVAEIDALMPSLVADREKREHLEVLKNDLLQTSANWDQFQRRWRQLLERIDALLHAMDFAPLYNRDRQLFSIGYNVEEEKLTDSSYDLLASEARLASYLAIVRRQVPVRHWFKLGRALTRVNGHIGLVSWTGSMFEYLMPPLVMKTFPNSLLAETHKAVLAAQQEYGRRRNVPWGTSESGYHAFDLRLSYQYRAFGVPVLGLKRGLVNDTVISGYSTLLALPFAPAAATANLTVLEDHGGRGEYGLYEAIDYTPQRLPPKANRAVIKSFMAHHQGMGLLAMVNRLLDNTLVRRFHSSPQVRAGELLLQERIPYRAVITKAIREKVEPLKATAHENQEVCRRHGAPGPVPHCHLLGDGRYTVLITDSGTGYSRAGHRMVTRWREDPLSFNYGTFIFIRDLTNDRIWSATWAPLNKRPDWYRVRFHPDRAEFHRSDNNVDTSTDVVVSTEDAAEVRRVKLTNHSTQPLVLEVTSYLEPVLAHAGADLAHPAFSNLFVRTEALPRHNALLASRRPREPREKTVWAMHSLTVQGNTVGRLQFETSRAKFVGRGRDITRPAALKKPLSNSVGAVLDPAFSLRRQIHLPPGSTATVTFVTAMAGSRQEVEKLAGKYQDLRAVERTFGLAYTRGLVEARHLGLTGEDMAEYQDLASRIIFPQPLRRRHADLLAKNSKGQPGLWAYGISGDNPIVLVAIDNTEDTDILRQVIRAHEYWRLKGLETDLVILSEEEGGYLQPVHDLLRQTVQTTPAAELVDRPGGVFVRNINHMSPQDKILLYAAARLVLRGDRGNLGQQVKPPLPPLLPPLRQSRQNKSFCWLEKPLPKQMDLVHANGYGGFTPDGREYVIQLDKNTITPAPWSNVMANPQFGCLVTESGGGFTWAENSRENKLTPWSNDPVSDPPGEVVFIQDRDWDETWTVTPRPLGKGVGTIRHGTGYTCFEAVRYGLEQKQTIFVPPDDPVKITLLELKNPGPQPRRLTVTWYVQPVLGVSPEVTRLHIITGYDQQTGALMATNPFNQDFPGRTLFAVLSQPPRAWTGDRLEFLGPGGNLATPAALAQQTLSKTVGAGLDPCIALQVDLEIAANGRQTLALVLGQGENDDKARALAQKYASTAAATAALEGTKTHWQQILTAIQVRTPDPSLDILINTWLVYQTLSCRLWARSAFYQAGGAYGFRDQLQDAANLVDIFPRLTRQQILLHCAHQFVEGDVQHWWHPGTGDRGVRTRFSDDLLWLPWAVCRYLESTGDNSLLDEEAGWLQAEPLGEDEDERYATPTRTEHQSPVYQHCLQAIDHALKFGEHGLPLMGSGDWNDGMSAVGNRGRGESVWLAWFLISILRDFAPVCAQRGDRDKAQYYLETAQKLTKAVEEHGWDGHWYRRAYFDDGTPLGSANNPECSIDSIAQSWSVIAGSADLERQRKAIKAVETQLVREESGQILLLTPPFADSDLEPGYIKGYLPGVRENGGQYTHAAAWVIQAMALLGKGDRAWQLYHMINPLNHTRTPIECATYKVEPYVVAADVYAFHPNVGRGGWTWYTGASGWLFRVGLAWILGIRKEQGRLRIEPCIPKQWPRYQVTLHHGKSVYHITVENPHGVNRGVAEITVDGKASTNPLKLIDDGREHVVLVTMGAHK